MVDDGAGYGFELRRFFSPSLRELSFVRGRWDRTPDTRHESALSRNRGTVLRNTPLPVVDLTGDGIAHRLNELHEHDKQQDRDDHGLVLVAVVAVTDSDIA